MILGETNSAGCTGVQRIMARCGKFKIFISRSCTKGGEDRKTSRGSLSFMNFRFSCTRVAICF